MYIQSLEVHNFRNFETRHVEFSPEVNIVYGPNASGKTNLLEAVYMLSNLRSFRTRRLRDMIQWERDEAYLRGIVRSEHEEGAGKALAVKLEPSSRSAYLHGKLCRSSKDYLQVLPSTAFIPDDLDLVKGQPAARRFFLDRGTFQYYPPYWAALTDYKKNLQQKNAALRQQKQTRRNNDANGLREIWNEPLQRLGSQIIWHRLRFLQGIRRLLPDIYARWLGDDAEQLEARYSSSIRLDVDAMLAAMLDPQSSQAQIVAQIARQYADAANRSADREQRLGVTVVGPHRDDVELLIQGRDLRSFGSQGQQRTAVLALKMAEVLLYFEQHREYAVLVLDDVTSELDDRRTERLFDYVRHGMQVFISTTSQADFPVDRSLECAYFDVSASGA